MRNDVKDRNEELTNKLISYFEHQFHPDHRTIEEVTEMIGYRGLEYFLDDNPGACEAIMQFLIEYASSYTSEYSNVNPEQLEENLDDWAEENGVNLGEED